MDPLLGCDFSSSPSSRKPIVVAWGVAHKGCVQLQCLELLHSLDAFSAMLDRHGTWVGGFDLPFGLPRELVETLEWPTDWAACMRHYARLSRADIRNQFAAFCDARPSGRKFAHRATDKPAASSPSMKWVNPPVAYMLHVGVPRLMNAGVYFPGLQPRPTVVDKVALEAYPGLLAREILGHRSYKSDDKSKQTPDRLIARKDVVNALELGQTRLHMRLRLSHALRDRLVEDGTGDCLDAMLCLMQAAWAQQQHVRGAPLYGLPSTLDGLEGWIISA